jgi:hypothetical protein
VKKLTLIQRRERRVAKRAAKHIIGGLSGNSHDRRKQRRAKERE